MEGGEGPAWDESGPELVRGEARRGRALALLQAAIVLLGPRRSRSRRLVILRGAAWWAIAFMLAVLALLTWVGAGIARKVKHASPRAVVKVVERRARKGAEMSMLRSGREGRCGNRLRPFPRFSVCMGVFHHRHGRAVVFPAHRRGDALRRSAGACRCAAGKAARKRRGGSAGRSGAARPSARGCRCRDAAGGAFVPARVDWRDDLHRPDRADLAAHLVLSRRRPCHAGLFIATGGALRGEGGWISAPWALRKGKPDGDAPDRGGQPPRARVLRAMMPGLLLALLGADVLHRLAGGGHA